MTAQKPREIALRVLRQRDRGAAYVEHLLEVALAGAALAPPDRALCQELTYGVARWQATLDWLIARKTDGRAQPPALQSLLRLGLYQLFWLDRIPDHAAVNETVALARESGFGAQAGFLNAVLRGCLRERDATEQLLAELKTRQPALGWSHPEWLWMRWRERWGADATARLMEWNNTPAKTYARVNTLKTEPGALLKQWREEEDVEYDFLLRDWTGENLVFELKSHPPLAKLRSFQQGRFYVQDPSTLLAVRELDPQPGETVLDLCAAPGGKTTHIAQLMGNQGRLVACDLSADRLNLLQENCTRLGVTCVEPIQLSALDAHPSTLCDRVLADVPCSNTGVMRRRIDLRWRLRPEDIGRLSATQLELLRRAAGHVKPGGTLVYSTCSLEPEENGGVVERFLALHTGFKLERTRELRPFSDGVDGAFVARLVRS
jgi:16S rRNA (cytosine967-C5)-methyltransferase